MLQDGGLPSTDELLYLGAAFIDLTLVNYETSICEACGSVMLQWLFVQELSAMMWIK